LKKLQPRFELRVAVIAAVALLIAQFGAMAHAYSHDPTMGSASTQQSNPGSHDFCGDCLNFAPLLSAAGTPTALLFIAPQGRSVAAIFGDRSLLDLSLTLAFRSRAPPVTR
jgi:hypothetical protein